MRNLFAPMMPRQFLGSSNRPKTWTSPSPFHGRPTPQGWYILVHSRRRLIGDAFVDVDSRVCTPYAHLLVAYPVDRARPVGV